MGAFSAGRKDGSNPVRLAHTLSRPFAWARRVCVCAGSRVPTRQQKQPRISSSASSTLIPIKPHAPNNDEVIEGRRRGGP